MRGGTSRSAISVLRHVATALRDNSLDIALREIDSAWRCLPEDADVVAPVYGRLLALEETNHDAALRILQRVSAPDPDVVALAALSLLRLRRGHEALQQLESALTDFCVLPDGLLANIAAEFLQHPDTEAVGWIGLGPGLEFIGELREGESSRALEIRLDDGAEFTQPLPAPLDGARRPFQFVLPQLRPGATLKLCCHGVPLLGSGLRIPTDFGLDGRATASGRRVSGWARLGWLPTSLPELRLEDELGGQVSTQALGPPQPNLRWTFVADLRRSGIRGDRVQISARVPDGRWLPLPDTPLLFDGAVQLPGPKPGRLTRWSADPIRRGPKTPLRRAAAIDVIIPVYRSREESLACIHAALATAGDARVVVVDDATDDVVLAGALDDLEAAGQIVLLRNATNLGFVESVNRALARNRTHDAVLLNSDTLVFGDWLDRLRAAAYRTPDTGTVTPFTNNGEIAGYPRHGEQPMSADEAAALNRLAAETNSQLSSDIPVGVGFCLYLRRDCLREVGDLDAALFGKGYGEETDFCLRARRLGWSHQLAADVFVYHAGGRSFGTRRAALLDRGRRLINMRHPGYDGYISDFFAQDPLILLRRRLDEPRLRQVEGQFVLLVTLALGGGVQRYVADRCREIRAQGLLPLVLRPHKAGDTRRCELWTDAVDVPNLQYRVPQDLEALTTLLGSLPLRDIEIQHFLDLDVRVIDMVRALGRPYDVVIHDYALICPRITLIDKSGRYCGEPAVSVCESCVRRNGSRLREKISVTELRKRSESWLRQARRVIAPSADTASRLHNYFALTIDVRPHTVPIGPPMRQGPALSKIVRVAVIGAIGEHKGYQVLLKCARDAKKRGLPLEFVVIGYTENDKPLTDTGKVLVSGRYAEGEASHLLRRENPDVAFLPSVYPETWCYALDEAVAVGLPVVAFDLGAIAERVREMGGGVILPLGEEPGRINDRLVEFAARPGFSDHQDEDMSQGIPDSSNMSNTTPDKDSAPPDALTASVQVLPLPAGLYLFSVKSAPTPADRPQGQLRLPAMHVGLGPGVRSEQVEFVTGPSTDGAWLFAQDDMLVTKVSSVGATLILTSVRAPGGEVLSIKVERLENRADATAADGPMAADSAAKTPADSGRKSKSEAAVVPTEDGVLPLKIGVHVRARGDLSFSDAPWAGRLAPGLWIESFSIRPLLQFEPSDIEYKGLTGSGFETPWLSDEKPCGTKGMAVPLVAFAVRLRPSAQTASYDCEYSGYFKSGVTIGPLRNGAPCRSTLANDPLEGIQVRISKRLAATVPAVAVRDVKTVAAASSGPTFGRYRDEPDAATGSSTSKSGNGAGHKSKAAAKSNLVPTAVSANLKQPAPKNPETNGAKTSAQRAASRRT